MARGRDRGGVGRVRSGRAAARAARVGEPPAAILAEGREGRDGPLGRAGTERSVRSAGSGDLHLRVGGLAAEVLLLVEVGGGSDHHGAAAHGVGVVVAGVAARHQLRRGWEGGAVGRGAGAAVTAVVACKGKGEEVMDEFRNFGKLISSAVAAAKR